MTLKHFIERPVLASVISIVIVIGGLIGLATLPVEQYPDIAPPTVMVRASYPGASAETIQKSVIIPLEEAINGVENMMYIKSEASNAGSGSITVYFKQGTDADMAAKLADIESRTEASHGGLAGSALVSDGFFPFRDGVDVAVAQGVAAIAQPGGSLRDAEVIAAANERDVAMVFTGQRSFKH